MCGRKTGAGQLAPGSTVKLRDACKANEVQVDPVALGLQGPKGNQGDPGAPGSAGPGAVLKDANGTIIGPAFFYGPNSPARAVAALTIGSKEYGIDVRPEGTTSNRAVHGFLLSPAIVGNIVK
jgi:hypothetical protein